MKNLVLLPNRADVHDYLKPLWRTEQFRRSHARGGLVHDIVDRFAALPRFFYEMSDDRLERAHFSVWWSGVALRDYGQASCQDLYLLHELAHGADMVHIAGQPADCFKRKMQDNELYASVVSEIIAYFDMPDLRPITFYHEIFADRFLQDPLMRQRWKEDPARLFSEIYYRRRKAMFHPQPGDPIEQWLHGFTGQNEKWFAVWQHDYDGIERHMERLTREAAAGRRKQGLDALVGFLAENAAAGGGDIPFKAHAEAFADVYWKERKTQEEAQAA
jgi:hypothetical protein